MSPRAEKLAKTFAGLLAFSFVCGLGVTSGPTEAISGWTDFWFGMVSFLSMMGAAVCGIGFAAEVLDD